MAEGLPYFKFYPGEYFKGNITLCSMEAQGIFVNLVGYYWLKGCMMTLRETNKRFPHNKTEIQELIDEEVIKIDKENISISFLDEQFPQSVKTSKERSNAGKASGMKRNKSLAFVRQLLNNKDKIIGDKIIVKIKNLEFDKDYIIPFLEWLEYKQARRESYKDDKSLQLAYNKLIRLSDDDPEKAEQIVLQSRENNWAGLFALKEDSHKSKSKTTGSRMHGQKHKYRKADEEQ